MLRGAALNQGAVHDGIYFQQVPHRLRRDIPLAKFKKLRIYQIEGNFRIALVIEFFQHLFP